MNVHFSSKTDDWATPQAFFDEINKEFGFTLDVCADENNHKVDLYYSVLHDGLDPNNKWDNETVWMNPPYGREISKWVKKASEARGGGCSMPIACSN